MPKKGPKKNKAHRSLDAAAVASKLYKRLSKSPGRSFALDDLAVDAPAALQAEVYLVDPFFA